MGIEDLGGGGAAEDARTVGRGQCGEVQRAGIAIVLARRYTPALVCAPGL